MTASAGFREFPICVLTPTRDVEASSDAVQLAEDVTAGFQAMGHAVHEPIVMWGNSIDSIRAELVCAFLHTDAEIAFLLDDDVCVTNEQDLKHMLHAFEDPALDVLAAAYLNRHSGGFFTIPVQAPVRIEGLITIECATVTLGATLIRRSVFEKMYRAHAGLQYSSLRTAGKQACALFQPGVLPAALLGQLGSSESVYCGEDKMFCVRAHEAGFKLHAAPYVETNHRGLVGKLSDDPLVGPMLRV